MTTVRSAPEALLNVKELFPASFACVLRIASRSLLVASRLDKTSLIRGLLDTFIITSEGMVLPHRLLRTQVLPGAAYCPQGQQRTIEV
ncbi:hypothetical protein Bpet0637 [Bordetella petrii]|uniref:Uncharacterized protein n=1 Tax=Bordetella petrii (strain ATCC BAA-461 / DSM 12804 / CCUG 43448 / CIP 107267 / Se-1111R) TaxID=340100 RepID=A9I4A4_BORPD|nr:hypothetical protein Bpet0637 [Bordetella petrii]